MIREHVGHLRQAIDRRSIPARVGIVALTLLVLRLAQAGVRTLRETGVIGTESLFPRCSRSRTSRS